MGIVLATLKLFYGFDDNFYGISLKMDKVHEISKTLRDETLEQELINVIKTFDKFRDQDPLLKTMTSLPKFDDISKVLALCNVYNLTRVRNGRKRYQIKNLTTISIQRHSR